MRLLVRHVPKDRKPKKQRGSVRFLVDPIYEHAPFISPGSIQSYLFVIMS
jgi:hypothetical protein